MPFILLRDQLQYCWIRCSVLLSVRRLVPGHGGGTWNHGWSASTLGPQGVQGSVAAAVATSVLPDNRLPEPHLRVGPRSSRAPQVHGHQRRPAQRAARLLLLAHGLVDGPQASRRAGQGSHRGHDRPRAGLGGRLAAQVSLRDG